MLEPVSQLKIGVPPLFLQEEEIIHDRQDTLQFCTLIKIIEVQDFSSPMTLAQTPTLAPTMARTGFLALRRRPRSNRGQEISASPMGDPGSCRWVVGSSGRPSSNFSPRSPVWHVASVFWRAA
jgi:hypothetical protein